MIQQYRKRGVHRRTRFVCDGCGIEVDLPGAKYPPQWVDLAAFFGKSTQFCPRCAECFRDMSGQCMAAVQEIRRREREDEQKLEAEEKKRVDAAREEAITERDSVAAREAAARREKEEKLRKATVIPG